MVDHKRFLVIGGSGRVGARLAHALGRHDTVVTYRTTAVNGGVYFDSTGMRLSDTLLRENTGLTRAFVLQGITNIDECARDPAGTAAINVESMRAVVDDLLERDIVPVFTSSDAVFDGLHGGLREEDPARPILTYGRQKLEIERYLLERAPRAIVVRLAKVVGTGDARSDMLEGWLEALDAGREVRCARDQVFTPIHLDDAVHALIDLAQGSHRGVFHAGGPDVVTRLELLHMLLDAARPYVDREARVVECNLNDLPFAEARPLDASLQSEKLYTALGWRPMGMREACRRAALAHYGAASRESAAGAARSA